MKIKLFGEEFEVDIWKNSVKFTVPDEYGIVLNYGTMKTISDFFGTENIEFDRIDNNGCETCGTGEEHGFTATVKDITKWGNVEILNEFVKFLENKFFPGWFAIECDGDKYTIVHNKNGVWYYFSHNRETVVNKPIMALINFISDLE